MSGNAMMVIDASSVASSTASVALERAIHLYRSPLVAVIGDQVYRLPEQVTCRFSQ